MERFIALLLLAPLLLATACKGEVRQPDEGRHDVAAIASAAGGPGQALLPIMQALGREMTTLTSAVMTSTCTVTFA